MANGSDNGQGITFQAIFSKATTTVDGGWRISFDVSEDEAQKITQLSAMRASLFQIAAVPIGEKDFEIG